MTIFVSNLIIGLEKGLDKPKMLLKMVEPFGSEVGIEFFIHTRSELYLKRLKEVKSWIRDLPITLHGPFLSIEASSCPGTEEYANFVNAYGRAFDVASDLKCEYMVFHDHECYVDVLQKEKLQRQCLLNMTMLMEKAENRGIKLLLENLALPSKGEPIFNEQEYIGLAERFPQAEFLIDVGHLNVSGWNMEKVISSLADRIKGYHLHNNDGENDLHRRIGNGTMDYNQFFNLYRKYTPDADITLEYGDNHGITISDVHGDIKCVMKYIKDKEKR